ncbi:MAG: 50S ribosomal protein L25/general stress protein Ctc [Halieaceae bacterium]|nr:50S ribosomal protein L25/general stress protein Ctc [Halieaceae bacterium]
MSDQFEVAVSARSDIGKGASRRLRRLENLVPGVVYGGHKDPVSVSVVSKDIEKSLENEAFYSRVLTLNFGDHTESAVLKDLQRHPATNKVVHLDFLRVVAGEAIKVQVPLHFTNEDTCIGVKIGGGMVQHQMNEIEVSCLPKDIPEFIEVDMVNVEVGTIVHLSDLTLPKGVTSVALSLGADHDLAVASVTPPKGGATAADDAEETADTDSE